MASSDLNCFICRNLYTDPVSLRCGHNFCCSCIVSVLDAQEAAGGYSCPDCRAEYRVRPAPEKKRKLRNRVERFSSSQPGKEETRIFCAYCTKSPVPAVKSCLQCENTFCNDHLTAHNKTMDHILIDPTRSFDNKKCSLHKKVLEYYCPQDAACLCVSCCLIGEHQGHLVELVDVASEKKRKKMMEYPNKLNAEKVDIQSEVQNLQEHKRKIQEKASYKRKNISKIFMDIKEQLEMAEKKALSEVSRQEEKIVSQISDLIKELEIQEDELSRKMLLVEEMCCVTDPIRLLQENDITVCSLGDGGEVSSEEDLDEVLISLTLHRSMRDIVTNVTSELGVHVPDILLDVDTAHECVKVSVDLKTATGSDNKQERPESPGRFVDCSQVLSRCGLSSGRHYWEVEWDQKGECSVGLSYPSIERKGDKSAIGYNDKSWSLDIYNEEYSVWHNSNMLPLSVKPTCPTLGIFLDYEAGRLSFYELCDPIRHIHMFHHCFIRGLIDETRVWDVSLNMSSLLCALFAVYATYYMGP